DAPKPKVVNAVTLELTPKDAEMLDLARSVGTLSLVLRNQTDPKAVARGGGATKAGVVGLKGATEPVKPAASAPAPVARRAVVVAAAPVARTNCVEVIR